MLNQEEERPVEEKIAVVDGWIETVSRERRVGRIDPEIVRDVLVEFGADLEKKEALQLLGKYSNKTRAPGMRGVWGERFDEYKEWIREYVEGYESEGRSLPALGGKYKDEGIKNSGMIQFFGSCFWFWISARHIEN